MRIPVIDIKEVSAGGGTIAWIDAGGALTLGPRSAGADPGPVCYARGGTEPTVTDANVVLGRIDAVRFLGGTMPLDPRPRPPAPSTRGSACPLGLARDAAAAGVVRLADVKMALAVRSITTERGLDPRDYALVAYGGGGPLHAVAIARELGIPRVVVPPSPSTFSAWGMLATDLRHDLVRTVLEPLERPTPRGRTPATSRCSARSRRSCPPVGAATLHRAADLRYLGQEHTVTVTVETLADWPALRRRFDEAHQRAYGYAAPEVAVQLLNLRLAVVFPSSARACRRSAVAAGGGPPSRRGRSTRRSPGTSSSTACSSASGSARATPIAGRPPSRRPGPPPSSSRATPCASSPTAASSSTSPRGPEMGNLPLDGPSPSR